MTSLCAWLAPKEGERVPDLRPAGEGGAGSLPSGPRRAGQIATADLNSAFAALDVNHDGSISKREFLDGAAEVLFHAQLEQIRSWKTFAVAVDTTGDGIVDKVLVDSTGDGKIDKVVQGGGVASI